ncbi:MAG: response regulator [Deltaproteobacteria bacterium]|nr:response regulator [Deltaproteobacteria bacterium]
MSNDEKPYTTGEVAELSHVTINAVKKWISAGKLPAFKTPGGHFRIKRDDFRRFIVKYRLHVKDNGVPVKRKVLIVDDDTSMVGFLKKALEASKDNYYDIEVAGDGYEALIKVGSFRPELLVLDIKMPRIDGLEVCRRLRADEKTSDTKILAITGFGGDEDVSKVLEAGADNCLSKPMQFAEFKESVEKLLG